MLLAVFLHSLVESVYPHHRCDTVPERSADSRARLLACLILRLLTRDLCAVVCAGAVHVVACLGAVGGSGWSLCREREAQGKGHHEHDCFSHLSSPFKYPTAGLERRSYISPRTELP